MDRYYFLGTFLPPLLFDTTPEITFGELDRLYRDNLTGCDYHKILVIRQFYDILNLRSLWKEEELDPRGNMEALQLDEAVINRVGLPDYVYDFIDLYPKKEDRLHFFPFLLAKFFQLSEHAKDPFLHQYFTFERELRLMMTAYRAKKLGRDLSVEFQFENPEEDLIAQLLAQQDAQSFEPPEKYRDLKILFEKHGDHPLALQKALDEYRFDHIESLVDMADVFSTERMLAYFTQFLIVEKWLEMDSEKGMRIVDAIVKRE